MYLSVAKHFGKYLKVVSQPEIRMNTDKNKKDKNIAQPNQRQRESANIPIFNTVILVAQYYG